MLSSLNMEPLDFAALLCSKLCHDLISPVGAITNGLEVLEEEKDEEMREIAFELIRKSARTASAKLQFARLAFGAAGSSGAEVDLGEAETLIRHYLAGEKPELDWQAPRRLMPKNEVKLLLNLILLSMHAIPRGGRLTVTVEGERAPFTQRIVAAGPAARIPPKIVDLLAGKTEAGVDAHAVQPLYTRALAREAGLLVEMTKDEAEDKVVFAARPL